MSETPVAENNNTEVKLSKDQKLDRIMETLLFQQHLLLATLKAMDKLLEKRSSIIKPIGT